MRVQSEQTGQARVVVWGLLAARPFGGMTWQILHYIEGLRRLGFDVWYVEDRINDVIATDPWDEKYNFHLNVEFAGKQMERLGLGDRWAIRDPVYPENLYGLDEVRLKSLYTEADMFLNVTGSYVMGEEQHGLEGLIYIETDPVLNQVRVAEGFEQLIRELNHYSALFTYGENIGEEDCPLPAERFTWHPTRPPVIMDWWVQQPVAEKRLTTIASWEQSGRDLEIGGHTYLWSKSHEFRKLLDLPSKSPIPMELCLGKVPQAQAEELIDHGWIVTSAADVWDPEVYRAFICQSLGEFTVAKDQNIRLNTGWFSDRSACYLAAGRPVITQETGFSKHIPVGEGLFSFTTEAEAIDALAAVKDDYDRHSGAAVEIAREYFSYDRLIPQMLNRSGVL